MSESVAPQDPQKWLLEKWTEQLTEVIESMVDERPSLTWTGAGVDELGETPLLIEQKFAGSPDPLLWIGVPQETWQDLGARVLKAAGVETVSDEESRNTCLELFQQSIGGLAKAMTAQTEREVAVSPYHQPAFFPEGLSVIRVTVEFPGSQLPPLWIAFAPLLFSWLEEKPAVAVVAELVEAGEEFASPFPGSKTFDLLLDVALPVSVSFGKTELPVRDVLKLTTGSVVELNRAVNDPVEVIVNNCVIARGEVVVVDGNYGVRIHQIVSRQERLKTGTSSAAACRVSRE